MVFIYWEYDYVSFYASSITVWIDRTIDGNREGTAAGLLDECILDDDEGKCERFSNALSKLDGLLGVGAGEQF